MDRATAWIASTLPAIHRSTSAPALYGGAVAQAFDFAGTTNTVGAPPFAEFAKGGYPTANL